MLVSRVICQTNWNTRFYVVFQCIISHGWQATGSQSPLLILLQCRQGNMRLGGVMLPDTIDDSSTSRAPLYWCSLRGGAGGRGAGHTHVHMYTSAAYATATPHCVPNSPSSFTSPEKEKYFFYIYDVITLDKIKKSSSNNYLCPDTFDDLSTSTTCLYLSPSQLCLLKWVSNFKVSQLNVGYSYSTFS